NLASPAGYATHMREMIQAFHAEGHVVKTLIMGGEQLPSDNSKSGQSAGPLKRLIKQYCPRIFWETAKDVQLLRFDKYAAGILQKTIDAFQPDIIYERCTYLQLSGLHTARSLNIPHIYEINAPFVKERIEMSGKSLFTNKASQIEKEQVSSTGLPVVVS